MKQQALTQSQRRRQITLFGLGVVSGLLSGIAFVMVPGGWMYLPGLFYGLLVLWPWSWHPDARSEPWSWQPRGRPLPVIRPIIFSIAGYTLSVLPLFLVYHGTFGHTTGGVATWLIAGVMGAACTHGPYFWRHNLRFSPTFLVCVIWGGLGAIVFAVITGPFRGMHDVYLAIAYAVAFAVYQGIMAAVISFDRCGELKGSATHGRADD